MVRPSARMQMTENRRESQPTKQADTVHPVSVSPSTGEDSGSGDDAEFKAELKGKAFEFVVCCSTTHASSV